MRKILIVFLLLTGLLLKAHIKKEIVNVKDSIALINKDSLDVVIDITTHGSLATLSEDPYKNYIPKIIPSSPLSQVFEQYVNHPVTEYNGLPQIEIPLYEIKLNGITIPITLSYHAGGIQYNQYPGDVGLGWSIGATGYRVTRTVNNKPDEKAQHVDISYIDNLPYSTESNDANRGSYLAGLTRYTAYVDGSFTSKVKARDYDVDGEYDLFTYMAPTTSNQFILDVDLDAYRNYWSAELATMDATRDKISINNVELPKNSKQNINGVLNSFKIIDEQGNQFYFGGQSQYIENTYDTSSDIIRVDYQAFPTSWVLEKAITPTNDAINFTYEEYSITDVRPSTSRKIMIYDPKNEYYMWGHGQNIEMSTLDSENSPSVSRWVKMVKTISTAHETVTITRERGTDINGRIKEITVKSNANNSRLRRIVFNYENGYEYLLSNITIYGSDDTNGKVYSMEYYDTNIAGPFYPDHWGYATTSSKYNGFHNEFHTDQFVHGWYDLTSTIFTYRYYAAYSGYFNTVRQNNDIPCRLSLKRINYPTGGYSEYIYEKHKYYDNIERKETYGGGLRIKKIVSNPNDASLPVATEYQYSTGIPTFSLNHRDFADEHYILETQPARLAGFILRVKRIYSTAPLGDLSWGLFSVNYPQVTKLEYKFDSQTGATTGYNGKTISEYSSGESIYELGYMEPGTGAAMIGFSNIQHPFPRYISKYSFAKKPVILTRTYFDNNNKKFQDEKYQYQDSGDNKTFKGLKINQRMFCNGSHLYSTFLTDELERMVIENPQQYIEMTQTRVNPYDAVRSDFFDYGSYEYNINHKLLYTKTIKTYNDTDNPIEQKEQYGYDGLNRLSSKTIFNNTGSGYTSYHYPEASLGSVYSEMISKNMIGAPVLIRSKINGREDLYVRTNYGKNAGQTKNLILPVSVEGDYYSASMTQITYDLYDVKGNLLQCTGKDGTSTSYLWSYNYQYPIAEIKNATYGQVKAIIPEATLNSIAAKAEPASADMTAINSLRTGLPNAHVTTYTYKPLTGIATMTDLRGIVTYYEYDTFGRLKEIYFRENGTKKIVEQYQYNYRNQ